jgi:hypothetical protein
MPKHRVNELTSKLRPECYQPWYSESGLYYLTALDTEIEDLIADIQTPSVIPETQCREILARAFHQCGSVQQDGLLYRNLIEELKRGSTPESVFAKASEWGMESTILTYEQGGFPRPEDVDPVHALLRTRKNHPSRFGRTLNNVTEYGSRLISRISENLEGCGKRLLELVSQVITPILDRLRWSFAAIAVNIELPPGLSVEFQPAKQIPIFDLRWLISIISRAVPALISAEHRVD